MNRAQVVLQQKLSLYRYPAELIRVVDGDTIYVEVDQGFEVRQRMGVRLYGVNTPEISGRDASPQGKVAKDFVEDWLDGHKQIYLHSRSYNATDKYGRSLGEIYREGDPISLNQALLDAGLAVSYTP